MNIYRSTAKRQAWYDDPDEKPKWNLFGRIRSPVQPITQGDEENAKRRLSTHSESQCTPSVERERRSRDLRLPQHAKTMPVASSATAGRKRDLPNLLRNRFDRIESGIPPALFKRSEDGGLEYTTIGQLRATVFNSWLNILLLLVPAGFVVRYTKGSSLTTFLVNFFAILPLSSNAEFAIAELILRIGEDWGGLAYISISNFVQIVSCIFLLRANQLDVLQTNLIGGILSSILLILGLSIVFGGINRIQQYYNLMVAHCSANLLSLAATSLLIPTASHLLLQTSEKNLVRLSRGAACVLFAVYAAFLVFQFHSHASEWGTPNGKVPKRGHTVEQGVATKAIANMGAELSATLGGQAVQEMPVCQPEEDKSRPQLSKYVLTVFLILVVTITAFCTQFAVDSIDALSQKANLSKTFIGLILLPILNNDFTPITRAIKDDLHQAMVFTIGKCLQTSLFVTPLMVIIAWGMHIDLTMNFDGFEVISLFASVVLLNYLVIDGRASWIQGIVLIADWIIIALAAFFAT